MWTGSTLTAQGAMREEAMSNCARRREHGLQSGAEIAPFALSAVGHPLAPYAGMFKDNPLFDAWQRAIADRRQADEDQDKP
jgi:hypothetical protein